jgi:hypothetical protein
MTPQDLIAARKKAEEAVADMADEALRIKAFEVILASLLSNQSDAVAVAASSKKRSTQTIRQQPTALGERISVLANEAFFNDPRSLSEIQSKLTEHGWHYPQSSLSTPLIRLVRQRQLRRLQLSEGNKKVWKYSMP